METLIHELISTIVGGGSASVIALSLLMPMAMIWFIFKREGETKKERRELIDQFQKTIESDRKDLLQVIEKYQEGQISVIQAINDIRVLLASLGSKI